MTGRQRLGGTSVTPNKRLKLAAPGLGRIAFVPQRTRVSNSVTAAPAGVGRRSLSAIR
jgi:hypothetical protein